ncbi:MAG TPA: LacI family DNA-binding transcriptional regulator [Sphingomonas sp.]|jgi:LacI family transcriptional regulator|uniref:LacI family DNA-binding transcriptional regulator n=1 Tax=Sphingomonas sp. TaxID=28214 RepID=UPI002ED9E32D
MRATIRDVSKAAGVSIKTVSRVLNNERYVAPDTRRRIEAAMADLAFHPSLAARALSGHRSFQVALICDNPSPYYVYDLQIGVRQRCAESGVRMLVQPYDRDADGLLDGIASLIAQTHPDGVILTPPVCDHPGVLALLHDQALRFVRISPGTQVDLSTSVAIDNDGAAFDVVRHLAGLGHRRIGFIAGHPAYATSGQRMSGYLRGLQAAGLAIDLSLTRQGRYDFASGAEATAALLAMPDPPTAIFASSDDMAAGALAQAHRSGIAVPDRLSIVGFDNTALAEVVWPPLTTIDQPTRDLGYVAADLLLSDDATLRHRVLPHRLILRESAAAPAR